MGSLHIQTGWRLLYISFFFSQQSESQFLLSTGKSYKFFVLFVQRGQKD